MASFHFELSLLPLRSFDFFTFPAGSHPCRFGTLSFPRSFRALVHAASELRIFHVPLGLSPLPLRNFNSSPSFRSPLVSSGLRSSHVPVGISPLPLRNFDSFTFLSGYRPCIFGTSTSSGFATSELRLLLVPFGLEPMPFRNFDVFTFLSGLRSYLFGTSTSFH